MHRLKKIKKSEIAGFEKQVIDSLIGTPKPIEKKIYEQMRCKVEILGTSLKTELIDSFITNTDSLEDTIQKIKSKYGVNMQFKIINLYDEKVVARSLLCVGSGAEKETSNIEEVDNKIQKFMEEGKSLEEISIKLSHICCQSRIKEMYNSLKELNTKNLSTNKDNIDNIDLNKKNW